jgi:hypothetical protein
MKWKPGQSGNPAGRPPKGEALTDILKEKVDKHAIAEKLIEVAMDKGDLAALKYIYDRIDGRPKETIDASISEIPRYIGFRTPDEDESEDSEADTE